MVQNGLKVKFERFYEKYNRRRYVHPDPLEFLYRYPQVRDREIVGMIAASLAYGRVAQILKSVSRVLDAMEDAPYLFVKNSSDVSLKHLFKDFRHRFADGSRMSALIGGMRGVIDRHGSLNACFMNGVSDLDETVFSGMRFFTKELLSDGADPGHLVALPEKGSACKRMNLFLRWMVRSDRVDPGGWEGISPGMLVIPLDTHMHKIGRRLGLSNRKQADMKTALELTSGFKAFSPEDPTRYDFVLTRIGIRDDVDENDLFAH